MKAKIVGAMFILGTAVAPARAQTGDAAAGHELAAELCSSCHIVGAERTGSDVAPPFRAIATDPDLTFTELHAWRGPMHPVISNLALSARQMADINAYLDSLRAQGEPASAPAPSMKPPPAIQEAPPEKLGEPIEPE